MLPIDPELGLDTRPKRQPQPLLPSPAWSDQTFMLYKQLEEDIIQESLGSRFRTLLERRPEPRGVLHDRRHARI
jgi:hypothetical protein